MALERQGRQASKKHSPEWRAKTGETCIDCHKGIAHKLPAG
jgi:nitrate/TMAO reductase-like tetraheme cytochrome c subunit